MEFWISFWTWLLVGAMGVFAVLAVVVSIGGFFDVRAMFRGITEKHDDPTEP